MMGAVRCYLAASMDGFIAGKDNDISWLPELTEHYQQQFQQMLDKTGVIVMGRTTYETVVGFGGEWPYGKIPMLILSRNTVEITKDWIQHRQGDIASIVEEAKSMANGKDVYIDGGSIVSQAIKAKVVDELILNVVPIVLTEGVSLFPHASDRLYFDVQSADHKDGMLSITYVPK